MDLPSSQHLVLSPASIREFEGYGMAARTDGYLVQPTTIEEVNEAITLAKQTGRHLVPRGAGRSYGDASILAEGIVLDLTKMNRFISWDRETGIAECEPGVTIEQLWRTGLPNGWWPPVVSGTMFPTLGGALGMNIHGKNNFQVGTLGDNVVEIDLLTVDCQIQTLRSQDPLFHAVISSAGMLGIITRIKLRLKKVPSGNVKVYAESIPNWQAQLEAFEKRAELADYMVSWVDCFAKGAASGRGLFHAAWYDKDLDSESLLEMNQDLPPKVLGILPKSQVWRILKPLNNRLGMRFVNLAKHASSKLIGNKKMHKQGLVAFSFLLDYVPDWRKAYLPDGFIQYQTFIPKAEAARVFAEQIRLSQEAKLEPFLGVLKKHRPDAFLLSHAVDGYSLALDYKVTERTWPDLQSLCHRMNDLVRAAGGRFYLAKDLTLRPEDLDYLGSNLQTLRDIKNQLDPDCILDSDQARRLNLFPR